MNYSNWLILTCISEQHQSCSSKSGSLQTAQHFSNFAQHLLRRTCSTVFAPIMVRGVSHRRVRGGVRGCERRLRSGVVNGGSPSYQPLVFLTPHTAPSGTVLFSALRTTGKVPLLVRGAAACVSVYYSYYGGGCYYYCCSAHGMHRQVWLERFRRGHL